MPRRVEISQYFNVRGEENHVLFAAAVGHVQQVFNAVDALGNQARRNTQQNLLGAFHPVLRHRRFELHRLTRLDHTVGNNLTLRPLRFDQQLLANRVSPQLRPQGYV